MEFIQTFRIICFLNLFLNLIKFNHIFCLVLAYIYLKVFNWFLHVLGRRWNRLFEVSYEHIEVLTFGLYIVSSLEKLFQSICCIFNLIDFVNCIRYPFLENLINTVYFGFEFLESLHNVVDLSNSAVDFVGILFKLILNFRRKLIKIRQHFFNPLFFIGFKSRTCFLLNL